MVLLIVFVNHSLSPASEQRTCGSRRTGDSLRSLMLPKSAADSGFATHPCHSLPHTPVVLVHMALPMSKPDFPPRRRCRPRVFWLRQKFAQTGGRSPRLQVGKAPTCNGSAGAPGRPRATPSAIPLLGMGSRAAHDGGSRFDQRRRKQPCGLPFYVVCSGITSIKFTRLVSCLYLNI